MRPIETLLYANHLYTEHILTQKLHVNQLKFTLYMYICMYLPYIHFRIPIDSEDMKNSQKSPTW